MSAASSSPPRFPILPPAPPDDAPKSGMRPLIDVDALLAENAALRAEVARLTAENEHMRMDNHERATEPSNGR